MQSFSTMSGTDVPAGMQEGAKRYRITPLAVGSLSRPRPKGEGEYPPLAMLLVIDVDAVPGFREVIVRQQKGEEFDVTSRWASLTDRSGENRPPQLVLDFYLPEVDLGVAVHIDVDQHPDSIGAAIQSGLVVLVDPHDSLRLQREPVERVLDELRVFAMRPPDLTPAIGIPGHRVDLPRIGDLPARQAVTPEDAGDALEAFFAGGRGVAGVGVQMQGHGLSAIVLVDPDLASVKKAIPGDATLEGEWG